MTFSRFERVLVFSGRERDLTRGLQIAFLRLWSPSVIFCHIRTRRPKWLFLVEKTGNGRIVVKNI